MTSEGQAPAHEAPGRDMAAGNAMVAYLQVTGMGCPRCAERVRNGLLRVEGVSYAEIDLNERLAAVLYDPRRVAPTDMVDAVAAAGSDGHHHCVGEFLAQVPAEVARTGWG